MLLEHNIWITGQNYIFICSLFIYVAKIKKEELKNKHNKTARIKTMKVEHIVLGDRMILIYLQAH